MSFFFSLFLGTNYFCFYEKKRTMKHIFKSISITLAILIIGVCVVLAVLLFTSSSKNGTGKQGSDGSTGTDEILLPNKTLILQLNPNDYFAIPDSKAEFSYNPQLKIFTSSFQLIVINNLSLNTGDKVTIMTLPSIYIPFFGSVGYIGHAINTNGIDSFHSILYEQMSNADVNFVARFDTTLFASSILNVNITTFMV